MGIFGIKWDLSNDFNFQLYIKEDNGYFRVIATMC